MTNAPTAVVYDEKLGTYTIKLFAGHYKINGTIIHHNDYDYPITIKEYPDISKVYKETNIVKYSKIDGSEHLSISDYNDQYNKLLLKKNKENNEWDSLDDEFAFRKFTSLWKPVCQESTKFTPINIRIIKKVYSNNEWVIPGYCFDGNIFNTTCIYKRREFYLNRINRILEVYKIKDFKLYDYDDKHISLFIENKNHFTFYVNKSNLLNDYKTLIEQNSKDENEIQNELVRYLEAVKKPLSDTSRKDIREQIDKLLNVSSYDNLLYLHCKEKSRYKNNDIINICNAIIGILNNAKS